MSIRKPLHREHRGEPKRETAEFLTQPCPGCGNRELFVLDAHDLFRWMNGTHIQDAFPYLSAADRELMLTGFCDTCWDLFLGHREVMDGDDDAC